MRIAVHVFDGAEELDWVGPWEILGVWKMLADEDPNGPDIELCTVARHPGPVTCAKGIRVLPDRIWDDLGPVDVLLYPGGRGTRRHLGDEEVRGWVRGLAEAGVTMVSVCTGALVFADAGLLDGRAATTHHLSLDRLGTLGTDIEVRSQDRYLDHGTVATAAGVSAGIDLALQLVARWDSPERARAVREHVEYDPQPPVGPSP